MTSNSTRTGRFQIALAVASVLAALAISPPAAAQSTQKIAILVNDQVISEFDIVQRSRLLKLTGASGDGRNRATQELIEERLKLQEAKRLGIEVSDDEINQALQGIAQRTGTGSISRLSQALGASGINIKTLKDRFRAEIGWRNVVRRRFQREVQIREADILAAMRGSEEGEEKTTVQYELSQIVVVVPANASNARLAERRRDAEKIRQNVTSCSRLRSVASAFRDVTVRDLGSRTANQLPPQVAESLGDVPVGRASPAEKTGNGYEMVVVCDKAEVTGFEAARSPIETELRNEQGMILARRLLRDLRADALIEYR